MFQTFNEVNTESNHSTINFFSYGMELPLKKRIKILRDVSLYSSKNCGNLAWDAFYLGDVNLFYLLLWAI